MDNYDHVVQIDSQQRAVLIFRVGADGQRELFTSRPLPEAQGWSDEFERFAKELGENLLLDSPAARELLNL